MLLLLAISSRVTGAGQDWRLPSADVISICLSRQRCVQSQIPSTVKFAQTLRALTHAQCNVVSMRECCCRKLKRCYDAVGQRQVGKRVVVAHSASIISACASGE